MSSQFEAVLTRQMNGGGGGGLADVVQAGGSAGWFGGLLGGLFGGGAGAGDDAGGDGGRAAPSTTPAKQKGGSTPSAGPSYYKTAGSPTGRPDSVRTLSDDFSPTHRMWATQGLVQVANRESALSVKEVASAGRRRKEALHARFLAAQQQKVEDARQQEARKKQQEELLKYQKRYASWEMKVKQHAMEEEEERKKQQYASSANKRATSAKKRRAKAQRERHEEAAEQSAAASAAAKEERANRREQAKAAQRAEVEKARQYTAQVRHDTRRELREEGKVMFQAQRDAIAAEEKKKQELDAKAIEETRQRYLQHKQELKSKVESLHSAAKHARDRIDEQKKQDAAGIRSQLDMERARKERERQAALAAKKGMRDEIFAWKKEAIIVP